MQPIISNNFINIANVKNKDHRHLARKLSSKPETMERTCSECLGRGEIIPRPPKLQIILMVPWEKRYLEGSEGACTEKAYIARKMC